MPEFGENREDDLRDLLETGSDIAGGAAGALIGLGIGGPTGAILGGAGGPAVARAVLQIAGEFRQRVLGRREEARVGAAIIFAGEKIRQNREDGQQVRQDGFFDEELGNRTAAEEIFEGVMLAAQREHQEKKVRFYGNLVANIAFQPEISRERANMLIKLGEDLSYRQLCLLALFVIKNRVGLVLRDEDYRGGHLINPNAGALLQEVYDLYLRSLVAREDGSALLGLTDVDPAKMRVQGSGADLYNLMELWEASPEDLSKMADLLQ